MRTSNQIFFIKVAYFAILLMTIVYNFTDLKRGFLDATNGVGPKEKLNFISTIFLLIAVFVGIAIITKLYFFINSIHDKKVFSIYNIRRINTLGWYCILLPFLLYGFHFSKLDFTAGLTNQVISSINFEFWLLIFGITLRTIGFVFRKGIELQQEQDLMI